MTVFHLTRTRTEPPDAYLQFIDDMRMQAARRGLAWATETDAEGKPLSRSNWDLRVLTGSHARGATRLGGFGVSKEAREAALAAGASPADVPPEGVLGSATQDFIKAAVVERCLAGHGEHSVRDMAAVMRKFFSITHKSPWELSTEDFDRVGGLLHTSNVPHVLATLARLLNGRLLSRNLPIRVDYRPKAIPEFGARLSERRKAEKLPDRDALFELVRIVFQAEAKSHLDFVRFIALRLMVLTGLRINEVLMLPKDCLKWEEHVDIVTGRSASDVGGVGRSLAVRYFAEKQSEGGPGVLVEALQWVPERFHRHVERAIVAVQEATVGLRASLHEQHLQGSNPGKSDLRTFITSSGGSLNTSDLLFLCKTGSRRPLPATIGLDCPVSSLTANSLYNFIAKKKFSTANARETAFQVYGDTDEVKRYTVRPHSLRHLMNTELFRLNVPDTVITHQFGRQTIAQSYEYDHRTLGERLKFVQLPASAPASIKTGSTQELLARMVVSGVAASSHIGQTFKKVQLEQGDKAAFEYLLANTDGFHVTPYGFCLNSFSSNPCARHLKCFDNCKHFAASGSQEHVVTLSELRGNLRAMREAALARPALTAGRKNQIAHAEQLLSGVDRALAAQPNESIFPEGVDHSLTSKDIFK